mmetsp:Transcript_26889/g.58616  ORF Transcript_26889/g.58616 Transcript_26889/m.58616 type:complete len:263 (-) Transcript_26889:639-1427(-)
MPHRGQPLFRVLGARIATAHQHVQENAKGVEIHRIGVPSLIRHDLRRGVAIGAAHGAGICGTMELLRQAEVSHLSPEALIQYHVLELQVAKDDSDAVQVLQGEEHLPGEASGIFHRQAWRSPAAQGVLEVPIGAILHDQDPKGGALEGIVEGDDEGVPCRLQDILLAVGFAGDLLGPELCLVHELHREELLRRLLLHEQHLAKCALAEEPQLIEVVEARLHHRLLGTCTSIIRFLAYRSEHRTAQRTEACSQHEGGDAAVCH